MNAPWASLVAEQLAFWGSPIVVTAAARQTLPPRFSFQASAPNDREAPPSRGGH